MPQSYQRLAQYMTDHQLEASAASWEQYLHDPAQTPAAELVSYIFQPIK
jgi:effector-binding domain-containing protein